MKIGIMTFWWSQDNYGQLLQCYAMQKYLREAGHDAFLIRYLPHDDLKSSFRKKLLKAINPILLCNFLYAKINSRKVLHEKKLNNRYFDDFRNSFLKMSEIIYRNYSELLQNPPEADVYIVGSDQVWNPNFIGGNNIEAYKKIANAYFLNFGNKEIKRISYAASWGISSLDEEKIKIITPLLQKFEYVSVREKTGIQICELCGNKQAELLYDPTMLLCADDYREIYKKSRIRKPDQPYILLYILNNTFDFDINKVYKFADEKELAVIYVTGNDVVDSRKKFFATIPEWLYLIDNAEYVITNSFHCCVFSNIFNKKYGIVKLTGKSSEMNDRFYNIFNLVGSGTHFIENDLHPMLDEQYNFHIDENKATILLNVIESIC